MFNTPCREMINLDRHIEILLLDNDCVFVPGLGGFIAHYVDAQYDESTDSFLPPLRTLGFNAKLNINDFLLAQSYIECYDISYPEALRRIEEEVAELNQLLRVEGRCKLNDLGVLFINDDGNIEFQPCEAGILTPDLYGFDVIENLSLAADAVAEEKAEVPAVIDEDAATEESEPALTIRLSTLRYVAASAAAVLLFFMISQPLGNSSYIESSVDAGYSIYNVLPKDLQQPKKLIPTKEVELVAPEKVADSISVAEKALEAHKAAAAKAETTVVADAKTDDPRFVIVMVSRITQENALAYASKLTKEGYRSEAVIRPNGSKVVCGNFKSEEAAREQLRAYRAADERFEEAWVMELK